MLEKEIEKHVNDHAKSTGWLQYKFVSPGKRGVPDRMYFYRSYCLMIEFKMLGRKPTALQEKEMRLLRKAGIQCEIVDNVTEGRHLLDTLRYEQDEKAQKVPKVEN